MKAHWTVQAAVGTVVLTVLQAALSFLAPVNPGAAPALAGVLACNALTALVLAWIHARVAGTAVRRAAVSWLLWGGIQACALVEAILFDIRIPDGHMPWLFAYSLSVSAAFAAFLALTFRPAVASPEGTPAGPWPAWWRFAVADVAYIALYFGAGSLVYPYIRAFYEAAPMPPFAAVLALQVVRGLVLAAIVLLVVRQVQAPPLTAALAAGAALSVLGGVAPLLIDNPYMPAAVRYAHIPEVGVSNFLFGTFVGWLFRPVARASDVARADGVRLPEPAQPLG